MEELDKFCLTGDLSLTSLREKISQLSTDDITQETYNEHPFLHTLCMNFEVTLELVECILDSFPGAVTWQSNSFHFEDDEDLDFVPTTSHALHCACYNDECPDSVIELLLERYPSALEQLCLVEDGVYGEYYIRGLPLHYYLSRPVNVDLDIVKVLVMAYPESLVTADDEWPCYPIHVALYQSNVSNLQHEVLVYLLDQEPSSVRLLDGPGNTPLHLACGNNKVNLELFELLLNAWPDSIRMRNNSRYLPIHSLCCGKMGKTNSVDILRCMLSIDPTLARETNDIDYLPIHHGICKSFAFCKELIDAYPESLRVRTSEGSLPIHKACGYRGGRSANTIRYMLELYPESINARDSEGLLPIHHAVRGRKPAEGKKAEIVELLLMYDPEAATQKTTRLGRLPLHMACESYVGRLCVVQALFDVFPEAIRVLDGNGNTALTLATKRGLQSITNFLETQQAYVTQAQDMTAMMTPDENGWLPLHRALEDKAPLGSIKLLLTGNLSAVRVPDNNTAFPLHIACEFSSVKVVQYLVELESIPIHQTDTNKDSILHYACRGGNLKVVKYLLDKHTSLVASVEVNRKGELPIHLLCEEGKDKVDIADSTKCIEIIWRMLLANPEAVVGA